MIKIYCKCPGCEAENGMLTLTPTRLEMKMEKGDPVEIRCKKCSQLNRISLNDFSARSPRWLGLAISIFILFELTLLLLHFFVLQEGTTILAAAACGLALPVAAGIIEKTTRQKVNNFNHYKV